MRWEGSGKTKVGYLLESATGSSKPEANMLRTPCEETVVKTGSIMSEAVGADMKDRRYGDKHKTCKGLCGRMLPGFA